MRGPIALLVLLLGFGCGLQPLAVDRTTTATDGKGEEPDTAAQGSAFRFSLKVDCDQGLEAQGVLATGWFTTRAPGRYGEREWKGRRCDSYCGGAPEGTPDGRISECKDACGAKWQTLGNDDSQDFLYELGGLVYVLETVSAPYALTMVLTRNSTDAEVLDEGEETVVPMNISGWTESGLGEALGGPNVAKVCVTPEAPEDDEQAISSDSELGQAAAHGLFLYHLRGEVTPRAFQPGLAVLSATPPRSDDGEWLSGEFTYELRYDCEGCLVM